MLLSQAAINGEQACRANFETSRLEAPEDLAGEAPMHRIGLDEDESALDGHQRLRRSRLGSGGVASHVSPSSSEAGVSIGVSQ